MKNLKTYFKHISTSLMLAISLDGYRRTVINDIKNKETNEIIQETIRRSIELSNKLNEQIEQNIINNTEIESNLKNIKSGLECIQNKVNDLNKLDNVNNDLINESYQTLKDEAFKTNNIIDKVLEFINNNSSSSSNNFILQDILNNYNQFFDSLTTFQKGALAHTLLCIFILGCLFDILVAYYSNQLIEYYNLENKYPKLAKYLQLRRKFQSYYIKFNILLIIIVVLFTLYVNVSILLYII